MIPHRLTTGGRSLGEVRDCTVRALAAASGVSYHVAHAALKEAGRKDRHRFNVVDAIRGNRIPNFLFCRMATGGRITLTQYLRAFPKGSYMLRIRNHCFAVIDGVVHDETARKPREQVTHYWRVRHLPQTYAIRRMKLAENFPGSEH